MAIENMKRYLNLYLLLSAFHCCICVDLTFQIEEGQSEGTLVGNIAASANAENMMQIQEDPQITFHLVKQKMPEKFQLFYISKTTGKLYTARMLDAESLCKPRSKECFKILDVVVRSLKFLIKVLEIKVIIIDVNEYAPQFPEKQIDLKFSEDVIPGTKMLIPNAKDNDVGILNSQVSYEFRKSKNEPFTLQASENVVGTFDLSIKLEQRLDREIEDSYIVEVIAKDGGNPPKQSVLQVHITVTDVNDNFPLFTQNVYNVSISSEHDVAIPVLSLSAKDKDMGINQKIAYFISSETSEKVQDLFRIDEESGEIFINNNLLIKSKSVNKLYVEATDGGTPPLSSVAMVLVNVINEQNNAPTIYVNSILMSQEKVFRVTEDASIGSFIAYIRVTDQDTGDNGEVFCDLHHRKFQLQNLGKKKYKLTIKNPLDREIADHYDITISCQDKGFPPLHSDYKLSVHVEDVNDVPPTSYKKVFKFFVDENKKPNTSVGFINATDPDLGAGGKFTYSIMTHNEKFLPFRLTEDGLITTLISLDHELQETYKFQVLMKDHGVPSLNSTVNIIIKVMDENDNAPFFIFPNMDSHKMDVLYYPHQSKNITVLKASDRDSRENAFLKYEITRGNEKQLFSINRYTGHLSSAHPIRKEDAGSYELEFVVKDSGSPALSATMMLLLTLRVDNRTTSEMANSVQIQDDDKMQVNLVITITVIAVIISIVITASISVCVLRCNAQDNDPFYNDLNPSKQCFQDQRYLMYPTYQTTTWPGMYMTIDKSANCRSAEFKRELCQGYTPNNGQNGSPLMIKPWVPTDIACQMCVQDLTNAPNCENNENTTMMCDDFTWISTMPSHADSGQSEEGTEIFTPENCTRSPPAADKVQDTERKPIQETFSYSGDTNTPTMSFYKTIIDQSTLHKERTNQESATTNNGASNIILESKTPPMNSNSYSNFRPLPPVPKKQF